MLAFPPEPTNSTFQQHLPQALAARAAIGTHGDGQPVPGKWHLYPELSPDGLWTTPTDLARFAIEIALEHGGANHILSQSVAREMLTVQCHDDPVQRGWHLRWGLVSATKITRRYSGTTGATTVLDPF